MATATEPFKFNARQIKSDGAFSAVFAMSNRLRRHGFGSVIRRVR